MIAKEQMFEVYANYDFFWGGAGQCLGGVRTPLHPSENPPLHKSTLDLIAVSLGGPNES